MDFFLGVQLHFTINQIKNSKINMENPDQCKRPVDEAKILCYDGKALQQNKETGVIL